MKPGIIILAAILATLTINPASSDDVMDVAVSHESYEEHELNDAWLGMPVETEDGRVVGYVVDAPLLQSGSVKAVIIDISGFSRGRGNKRITVQPENVFLTDERVIWMKNSQPLRLS